MINKATLYLISLILYFACIGRFLVGIELLDTPPVRINLDLDPFKVVIWIIVLLTIFY